jgi:hypothetical protein
MADYLDMYSQGQQPYFGGLQLPATTPSPVPTPTPAPPPLSPGPPSTPQEMQQRKSGWAALADKLQSDPTYGLALLRLGTSLMQPVPVGQTPLGQAGYALQDSMNFFLGQQATRRQAEEQMARSGRDLRAESSSRKSKAR